jgi:hypothetical protein
MTVITMTVGIITVETTEKRIIKLKIKGLVL